jgi:cell fate (sporulation/competence/biofilm development) regulator YlbF (YheA/YmcA/DUF963 family)
MDNPTLRDVDVTITSEVGQAVHDFAVALTEAPQFQAFEQASVAFHNDSAAQEALHAYEAKVEELRALLMLNALGDTDRAELEQLRQALVSLPVVSSYVQAEDDLLGFLRATAGVVSEQLGLPFAVSRSGCCG